MNVDRLLGYQFEEVEEAYSAKDAILYALGIGFGSEFTDRKHLQFVYEDGLVVFPTIALVLAYPGFWIARPEFGVDWKAVLHGEQAVTFHRPIAPSGRVRGKLRVDGIVDKGPKGAFVYSRRELFDAESGELLATQRQTTVCRNDGGLAYAPEPVEAPARAEWVRPDGPPDEVYRIETSERAALLYRLSGDWNPLHADPDIARQAGFRSPILHGLCTFGMAARAVVESLCGFDASRLRHVELRFSAPMYPGETLVTSMWRNAGDVLFEAFAEGGTRPVVTQGRAVIE